MATAISDDDDKKKRQMLRTIYLPVSGISCKVFVYDWIFPNPKEILQLLLNIMKLLTKYFIHDLNEYWTLSSYHFPYRSASLICLVWRHT